MVEMIVEVSDKVPGRITETSVLQQTAFWSDVKRRLGVTSKAFDINARSSDPVLGSTGGGCASDDVLVLFQEIGDGYQLAYVPYGPTLRPSDENQGVFLEELSEAIRPYLPESCILIRYDLAWESLWAKDDSYFDGNGNWSGPPRPKSQEIRLNMKTLNWNLRKANTDILPAHTVMLDLTTDEQHMLSAMKPKTRYNIRLSGRRGVRVREASLDEIGLWYDLYRETAERNRIFLPGLDHFRAVLAAAESDISDPVNVDLLIAELDGKPVAAMFLATTEGKATYLYGASSKENRNSMATYALQWHAIKLGREKGCATYDMFGVAPRPDPEHPMYGLYRFKTGFGGRILHRMGCWDYPLNEGMYAAYKAFEMKSQGFHLD